MSRNRKVEPTMSEVINAEAVAQFTEMFAKGGDDFVVGLNPKTLTPETVLATLAKFIRAAKWIVMVTPTSMDNKFVDIVENLSKEPWFIDLLTFALSFTGPKAELIAKLRNFQTV